MTAVAIKVAHEQSAINHDIALIGASSAIVAVTDTVAACDLTELLIQQVTSAINTLSAYRSSSLRACRAKAKAFKALSKAGYCSNPRLSHAVTWLPYFIATDLAAGNF